MSMIYEWDVEPIVDADKLKDVLNEFDDAGYDIYSVFQLANEPLKYTVVARQPKYPFEPNLNKETGE